MSLQKITQRQFVPGSSTYLLASDRDDCLVCKYLTPLPSHPNGESYSKRAETKYRSWIAYLVARWVGEIQVYDSRENP